MKKLLLAPMFLAVASAQTTLSIHLYKRAEVPARILQDAVREASRILSRAGVETVWIEKPPNDPEGSSFDFSGRSGYQHPEPDKRDYLVVSIGRGGSASFRETFGFALPDAHAGVCAFIMYDQVERLTDPRLASVAKMLGSAMAHEVGHVLLGSVQHSSGGLMKARWDKADYMRAQAGMMLFAPSETEIIREHARSRMKEPPDGDTR